MIKQMAVVLILFFAIGAFALAGCSKSKPVEIPNGTFQPYIYPEYTYMNRVQNFILLIDVSSSMGEPVGRDLKLDLVRQFIYKMCLTLPEYEGMNVAVRTFGHDPLESMLNTKLVKSFSPYSATALSGNIGSIHRTGGQSPIGQCIDAATLDLASAEGEIAVLIFSDGAVIGKDAILATRRLKKQFGCRLSVYPVMVGNDGSGMRYMKELAWVGESGFFANTADISTSREMAEFVRRVFLVPYPDTDGDSVIGMFDECPDTPPGAEVDNRGCWVLENIEYAFDRANVRPEYYPVLDSVLRVLEANPGLKVEIQGHTDNIGSAGYNEKLSFRRAESVKQYLLDKGVPRDRLYTAGYGFSRPVASNDTVEGRSLNRRVELQPVRLEKVGRSVNN